MKVTILESELLAQLAKEIAAEIEPDCPADPTHYLPNAVNRRLKALIMFSMFDPTLQYISDEVFIWKDAVARLKSDPTLKELLELPWKDLHLVDAQGTIVLTF